jgi:hypothetical protein
MNADSVAELQLLRHKNTQLFSLNTEYLQKTNCRLLKQPEFKDIKESEINE